MNVQLINNRISVVDLAAACHAAGIRATRTERITVVREAYEAIAAYNRSGNATELEQFHAYQAACRAVAALREIMARPLQVVSSVVKVAGSGGETHYVQADGSHCTCKAFAFSRAVPRDCKHCAAVRGAKGAA